MQREIETKASELDRSRANELELAARLRDCEEELKAKEQTAQQVISDCQASLQAKTAECELIIKQFKSFIPEHESVIEQLSKELHAKQLNTADCEKNEPMVEQLQNMQDQPNFQLAAWDILELPVSLLQVHLWSIENRSLSPIL